MNILIVGAGKPTGSWAIRGHQIGAAMGARVTSSPNREDFDWCDLVVVVKRALLTYAGRTYGKPIVWDAVDFWGQPAQNGMTLETAKAAAASAITQASPRLVIGATQAMADDIGGVYLPHHAWLPLRPARAREKVSVVAYQGHPSYLGRWSGWLDEACRVRGWKFQVNPDDLRDADIVVAFRDGQWDGEICRRWKSGVKLVNAMVAGRPVIGQASSAWTELAAHGTVVERPDDLQSAFDIWASGNARRAVAESAQHWAETFHVDAVAADYLRILEGVACPA